METVNCFLVRLKLGSVQEIRGYLPLYIDFDYLDHQMYVPSKFVLGHFKERKEGFVLGHSGICYLESGEEGFRAYEKAFLKGEQEFVRTLSLPRSELVSIIQQARAYRTARQNIKELVTPVGKYF